MGFAGHCQHERLAVLREAWELSLQAPLFWSQLPCQQPQAESFVMPCSPATLETRQGGVGTTARFPWAGIQRDRPPPSRSRTTSSWSHLPAALSLFGALFFLDCNTFPSALQTLKAGIGLCLQGSICLAGTHKYDSWLNTQPVKTYMNLHVR